MSTTTIAQPTETVTLRESDLLEAGIVALESEEFPQCRGQLRLGEKRCAEGVLAEMLIRALPDRYRWEDGEFLREIAAPPWNDYTTKASALLDCHWRELHPQGSLIEQRAARILGAVRIIVANDIHERTFPEIAAALRQARAEIEAEAHPDHETAR